MSNNKEQRLGKEAFNNQGCLMKIVEYNTNKDIVVEFQDEYKARVHTQYRLFLSSGIRNPYFPNVFGAGITGDKYPINICDKITKEYSAWHSMIQRCYDEKYRNKKSTYKNVTCCKEWLLYDNFYEWLHSQENFDKWYNGKLWDVDKDILVKGNKAYSPDTCCLVPNNVNKLFTKCDAARGSLPIGVCKRENGFYAYCQNPFTNKREHLGIYQTSKEAFQAYKQRKEFIIKQVAQEEYNIGNITKQCYEAMMNYEVDITD